MAGFFANGQPSLIDITSKPPNSLRIASWNIYGAILRKHELGEIAHIHNLDVIALQETFLLVAKRLALGKYEVYRDARIERVRGTSILVKKRLNYHQLLTPENLQQIDTKIIEIST